MTEISSSKNTWINQEPPKEISSLARFKDGYHDILEERRDASDLYFMMHSRKNVKKYKYNIPRSYNDLKEQVLNSDRVKYTIERLTESNYTTNVDLKKEAEILYGEMAHQLNITNARFLAFGILKVFKSIFQRIYVYEEGINKLKTLMQEYPVILIPTHRSYIDFLVLSYLCYHYELPLPAVAAAMDFKGMKLMGWLLQQCGAFYIRRSFGSDFLYWAIFTEYVQTQLRNGDHPLEFFVEGTRSRTNKSYPPKTGILSTSLESYFKAEVPDTILIPVTISFDRILEESLYAYELLGVPKPKESTSGLFKARSILNEDYGCLHVHIGDAISIRTFSMGKIDRINHSLAPRYINNLNSKEMKLIKDLSYHIVKKQQEKFVISPWSLIATILIQGSSNENELNLQELSDKLEWLKRQTQNMGAYLDWPGNSTIEDIIKNQVKLHSNLVKISPIRPSINFQNVSDLSSSVKKLSFSSYKKKEFSKEKELKIELRTSTNDYNHQTYSVMNSQRRRRAVLLENAAIGLMLASYRNQAIHLFVDVSIISLAIINFNTSQSNNHKVNNSITIEDTFESYCFLRSLLARDFVINTDSLEMTFKQAVMFLFNSGCIRIQNQLQQFFIKSNPEKFNNIVNSDLKLNINSDKVMFKDVISDEKKHILEINNEKIDNKSNFISYQNNSNNSNKISYPILNTFKNKLSPSHLIQVKINNNNKNIQDDVLKTELVNAIDTILIHNPVLNEELNTKDYSKSAPVVDTENIKNSDNKKISDSLDDSANSWPKENLTNLSIETEHNFNDFLKNNIDISQSINEQTRFYANILRPFIITYWITVQHLINQSIDLPGKVYAKIPKGLALDVQKLAFKLIEQSRIHFNQNYEVLSLDTINNALFALDDLKFMYKDKRNGELFLSPKIELLIPIAEKLEMFVENPNSLQMHSLSKQQIHQLMSKL